jgi:hypothetical protein
MQLRSGQAWGWGTHREIGYLAGLFWLTGEVHLDRLEVLTEDKAQGVLKLGCRSG